MSVDCSASLGYGYIVDYSIVNPLELESRLCEENIELPYNLNIWDVCLQLNDYNDLSDIFIGYVLEHCDDYGFIDFNSYDINQMNEQLDNIIKVLNVDISAAKNLKPQYCLLTHRW